MTGSDDLVFSKGREYRLLIDQKSFLRDSVRTQRKTKAQLKKTLCTTGAANYESVTSPFGVKYLSSGATGSIAMALPLWAVDVLNGVVPISRRKSMALVKISVYCLLELLHLSMRTKARF